MLTNLAVITGKHVVYGDNRWFFFNWLACKYGGDITGKHLYSVITVSFFPIGRIPNVKQRSGTFEENRFEK